MMNLRQGCTVVGWRSGGSVKQGIVHIRVPPGRNATYPVAHYRPPANQASLCIKTARGFSWRFLMLRPPQGCGQWRGRSPVMETPDEVAKPSERAGHPSNEDVVRYQLRVAQPRAHSRATLAHSTPSRTSDARRPSGGSAARRSSVRRLLRTREHHRRLPLVVVTSPRAAWKRSSRWPLRKDCLRSHAVKHRWSGRGRATDCRRRGRQAPPPARRQVAR
jgi:hypothetical protein